MGRRVAQRQTGFTLVETAIALVIVMLAMLFGLALLIEQPRMLERLERQRQAYDSIEGVLEAVRTGALPLPRGRTALGDGMTLEVTETDTPDLFQVEVTAKYELQTREFERSVTTAAWRP